MNAREKLKSLMGAKLRRLWLLGVKNWHLYYTPEDAEEIGKWDEWEAEEIWKDIYRKVADYVSGLSPDTCPFCNYYSFTRGYCSCFDCGYGKRHLKCAEEDSDFRRIVRDLDIFNFLRKIAFSHEWYWDLVERLDERG